MDDKQREERMEAVADRAIPILEAIATLAEDLISGRREVTLFHMGERTVIRIARTLPPDQGGGGEV